MLKMIIFFPRQARDKHTESTQNKSGVSADPISGTTSYDTTGDGLPDAYDTTGDMQIDTFMEVPLDKDDAGQETLLLRRFYTKTDHFTKTDSGQT